MKIKKISKFFHTISLAINEKSQEYLLTNYLICLNLNKASNDIGTSLIIKSRLVYHGIYQTPG